MDVGPTSRKEDRFKDLTGFAQSLQTRSSLAFALTGKQTQTFLGRISRLADYRPVEAIGSLSPRLVERFTGTILRRYAEQADKFAIEAGAVDPTQKDSLVLSPPGQFFPAEWVDEQSQAAPPPSMPSFEPPAPRMEHPPFEHPPFERPEPAPVQAPKQTIQAREASPRREGVRPISHIEEISAVEKPAVAPAFEPPAIERKPESRSPVTEIARPAPSEPVRRQVEQPHPTTAKPAPQVSQPVKTQAPTGISRKPEGRATAPASQPSSIPAAMSGPEALAEEPYIPPVPRSPMGPRLVEITPEAAPEDDDMPGGEPVRPAAAPPAPDAIARQLESPAAAPLPISRGTRGGLPVNVDLPAYAADNSLPDEEDLPDEPDYPELEQEKPAITSPEQTITSDEPVLPAEPMVARQPDLVLPRRTQAAAHDELKEVSSTPMEARRSPETAAAQPPVVLQSSDLAAQEAAPERPTAQAPSYKGSIDNRPEPFEAVEPAAPGFEWQIEPAANRQADLTLPHKTQAAPAEEPKAALSEPGKITRGPEQTVSRKPAAASSPAVENLVTSQPAASGPAPVFEPPSTGRTIERAVEVDRAVDLPRHPSEPAAETSQEAAPVTPAKPNLQPVEPAIKTGEIHPNAPKEISRVPLDASLISPETAHPEPGLPPAAARLPELTLARKAESIPSEEPAEITPEPIKPGQAAQKAAPAEISRQGTPETASKIEMSHAEEPRPATVQRQGEPGIPADIQRVLPETPIQAPSRVEGKAEGPDLPRQLHPETQAASPIIERQTAPIEKRPAAAEVGETDLVLARKGPPAVTIERQAAPGEGGVNASEGAEVDLPVAREAHPTKAIERQVTQAGEPPETAEIKAEATPPLQRVSPEQQVVAREVEAAQGERRSIALEAAETEEKVVRDAHPTEAVESQTAQGEERVKRPEAGDADLVLARKAQPGEVVERQAEEGEGRTIAPEAAETGRKMVRGAHPTETIERRTAQDAGQPNTPEVSNADLVLVRKAQPGEVVERQAEQGEGRTIAPEAAESEMTLVRTAHPTEVIERKAETGVGRPIEPEAAETELTLVRKAHPTEAIERQPEEPTGAATTAEGLKKTGGDVRRTTQAASGSVEPVEPAEPEMAFNPPTIPAKSGETLRRVVEPVEQIKPAVPIGEQPEAITPAEKPQDSYPAELVLARKVQPEQAEPHSTPFEKPLQRTPDAAPALPIETQGRHQTPASTPPPGVTPSSAAPDLPLEAQGSRQTPPSSIPPGVTPSSELLARMPEPKPADEAHPLAGEMPAQPTDLASPEIQRSSAPSREGPDLVLARKAAPVQPTPTTEANVPTGEPVQSRITAESSAWESKTQGPGIQQIGRQVEPAEHPAAARTAARPEVPASLEGFAAEPGGPTPVPATPAIRRPDYGPEPLASLEATSPGRPDLILARKPLETPPGETPARIEPGAAASQNLQGMEETASLPSMTSPEDHGPVFDISRQAAAPEERQLSQRGPLAVEHGTLPLAPRRLPLNEIPTGIAGRINRKITTSSMQRRMTRDESGKPAYHILPGAPAGVLPQARYPEGTVERKAAAGSEEPMPVAGGAVESYPAQPQPRSIRQAASLPLVAAPFAAVETAGRSPAYEQSSPALQATFATGSALSIQRKSVQDAGATTTQASADEIQTSKKEEEVVDLDDLAQQVYPIIKRLLAIERERVTHR